MQLFRDLERYEQVYLVYLSGNLVDLDNDRDQAHFIAS